MKRQGENKLPMPNAQCPMPHAQYPMPKYSHRQNCILNYTSTQNPYTAGIFVVF
ncbi:hypothetical protein HG267_27180 [Tolypothrix sp. PCC 7601]|uniref:hypothetical protein n=1 Tax=Tolypothrix sp. PCC 7712 TaxID=2596898 RepID=UPI0021F6BFEB|nr:hypothetical protein [Tolypothrix sp. PCC 7712]UYD32663.1 hypothetical protein HG267_27180 [Tolypothrix sp. PCC 7601]